MRGWANTITKHGTISGYDKHLRLDETPCDDCIEARRTYDTKTRNYPEQLRRQRADYRALQRLKTLFPEVYEAYYKEELEKDVEGS